MNEIEYPNDKLHEILDEILLLIGRIQKTTIMNRDGVVTGEYIAVKDLVPIDEKVTPGEPVEPAEAPEAAEGGEQEMFLDLNLLEVNAEEIMNKYAEYSSVAKLHHRKTHLDTVFPKTEDMNAMEPLAE